MARTKKDNDRYKQLVELGCIVCLNNGIYTPPQIHHTQGRTGDGNQKTIPLCYYHHMEGSNCETHVSRHPWLTEFEERYGTEASLLEQTNRLININFTD